MPVELQCIAHLQFLQKPLGFTVGNNRFQRNTSPVAAHTGDRAHARGCSDGNKQLSSLLHLLKWFWAEQTDLLPALTLSRPLRACSRICNHFPAAYNAAPPQVAANQSMLLTTNALSVCCCFELLATAAAGCWTV
jgi:hypothetical protein